ncbi:hypothetical protein PSHT_00751 [Puccinia striiformis]|uniref:Uncharacterized protein n=1 Tax=Puccinia striiformis TaxID=27350 RepID=A0A2S4WMH1_9BASI|nr:hypothetical protein PSHT_00751 [Puccinia striiformis]
MADNESPSHKTNIPLLTDELPAMVATDAGLPSALGSHINSRFASVSVNNKGRVWLRFMRYEYSGNLNDFIGDIRKLLNEIRLLQLGVPD